MSSTHAKTTYWKVSRSPLTLRVTCRPPYPLLVEKRVKIQAVVDILVVSFCYLRAAVNLGR